MSFSIAFLAITAPTFMAASILPVYARPALTSSDNVEVATSVVPVSSSISCAYICFALLNIFSRGRRLVPRTFFRTRTLRFSRAICLEAVALTAQTPYYLFFTGFAGLAQNSLVSILDSLALIRFRTTEITYLSCYLANKFFVD